MRKLFRCLLTENWNKLSDCKFDDIKQKQQVGFIQDIRDKRLRKEPMKWRDFVVGETQ